MKLPICRDKNSEGDRTWYRSRGTATALHVDSRDVALEEPSAGLCELGYMAHVVEHRLEDDVGVVL